ncbi:MAG TPA: DUF4350 domain-containing protein [Longimicrobiaceae bacterium]|nr:DUF4350 domain-containing protein [Longimicrobiaceae bacterium]
MSSRDRWLLIALCVIVVVLAAAGSRSGKADVRDTRATTFLNTPSGTRALYLALGELGIRVGRRTLPFEGRDSIVGPLAVIAPSEALSAAEWGRVMRFVRAGGTLIYTPSPYGPGGDSLGLVRTNLVSDSGGIVGMVGRIGSMDDTAAAVPHPWTAGVAPIPGFRYGFADTSRAVRTVGARPLLRTRRGRVTALAIPVGRGLVVALSDAAPLGNGHLRQGGTALLLARVAADATRGGRTLRFDEYHHGYNGEASIVGAVGRFLARTDPGHALLQLAAAGLGLLLLLGTRFGLPYPPPPAERRSPLEHVEALAGAYRQAGARATARRLLVAGLTRRLGRKPVAESAADGDLVERITARMPVAREAAQALNDEWKRGPQGDLVALARNVDRLLDEVKRP